MRKNSSTSACSALAAKNCFMSGVCSAAFAGEAAFLDIGIPARVGETGPAMVTGPPCAGGSGRRVSGPASFLFVAGRGHACQPDSAALKREHFQSTVAGTDAVADF